VAAAFVVASSVVVADCVLPLVLVAGACVVASSVVLVVVAP
jgi:hypothetical protein